MERIVEILAQQAQAVEDGDLDPLKVLVEIKKLENELKAVKHQISEAAYEEIQNYPKCKAEAFGAVIELRSSAGRWDFKGLSHWSEKKKELSAIESEAKDAYKASLKGQVVYDSEGVEVEKAEYTEGKETLYITLSK